ncbi:MAG: LysR family transcriptional regulator [Tissierellaceae bacterium]|nr:LysR family transcriptional regulator [Tissierellaceae bacterium]
MEVGYSLWIKNNSGEKIFGQGPLSLLILIDKLGSINKAAQEMGMSYSKATKIIKKTECNLNINLLDREIGGSWGGGSSLTDDAMELIRRYERFREESTREIERIYNEIFPYE